MPKGAAACLGGAGHPPFHLLGRAISFWIHLQLTGSAFSVLVNSSATSCVIHNMVIWLLNYNIYIYIITYIIIWICKTLNPPHISLGEITLQAVKPMKNHDFSGFF